MGSSRRPVVSDRPAAESGRAGAPHQRIVSPTLGHGLQALGGLKQRPSIWVMPSFSARPLTGKEMAQLMDLREGWGSPLIKFLSEWDQGAFPPLTRIIVEFILAALLWLGLKHNDSRPPAIAPPIV